MQKSYSPFGEQLTNAVSGFGYNGEYYNAQTGQIYLRARFYEPEQNRFSQKDILHGEITSPGSLNRYAYVQNDPVNFCDPSGMRQAKEAYTTGVSKGSAGRNSSMGTPVPTKQTPTTSKPASSSNSYSLEREYYEQRRAATTPSQQEYQELRQQGVAMSYGQYADMKQQTYFPSYSQYAYERTNHNTSYQTYGPLQAATGQYSTAYPRTPVVSAASKPQVANIVFVDDACSAGENSSAKITGITQLVKGVLASILEDSGIEKALETVSDMLTKLNPLLDKGAQPVIGPNIVNDLDPSIIANVTKGVNWLKDKAPYIGAAIDFISQIHEGEDIGHAAIKTGAHVGIGLGAAALITVTGIPGAILVAAASYVGTKAFDEVYDSYVREPLDKLLTEIADLFE